VVSQDVIRRQVLRVSDVDGNPSIDLIDQVARFSLNLGYHVVVEGTLTAARYGCMLKQLAEDHVGRSRFVRFDVPYVETVRRHATKPNADEFGEPEMRARWLDDDGLDGVDEQILGSELSHRQVVEVLAHDMPW
jgi:hypothetical protein